MLLEMSQPYCCRLTLHRLCTTPLRYRSTRYSKKKPKQTRSPYEILGVSKDISASDLKLKFLQKAKQYHPDVNPSPNAHDEFQKITKAYEELSEKIKQQEIYNKSWKRYFDIVQSNLKSRVDQLRRSSKYSPIINLDWGFRLTTNFIKENLLLKKSAPKKRQAIDYVPTPFYFRPIVRNYMKRYLEYLRDYDFDIEKDTTGSNLTCLFKVPFETALNGEYHRAGTERLVRCTECKGSGHTKVTAEYDECLQCHGTGKFEYYFEEELLKTTQCPQCNGFKKRFKSPCPNCSGFGIVRINDILSFYVPPLTKNGDIVKLPKKGHVGRDNTVGDAIIQIMVDPHPVYEYGWENDFNKSKPPDFVKQTVDLDLKTAMLGGSLKINTFFGETELNLKSQDPAGAPFGCINHGETFVVTHDKGNSSTGNLDLFRGSLTEYKKQLRSSPRKFGHFNSNDRRTKSLPLVLTINLKIPKVIDQELQQVLEQNMGSQQII
ncbi:unnamed protein product [Moneuplotes crassus]|uniref:Uncharacterized protein n=1 Tax=Euplotes crassus TaxID=5936 RepID=A0AAD1Y917_EUPCR|nr:unnamed protein product [Moneuplotes crassus]